jgi:hypothetical protein
MDPPAHTERYKNHRFPARLSATGSGSIIGYQFSLSYHDVQGLCRNFSLRPFAV